MIVFQRQVITLSTLSLAILGRFSNCQEFERRALNWGKAVGQMGRGARCVGNACFNYAPREAAHGIATGVQAAWKGTKSGGNAISQGLRKTGKAISTHFSTNAKEMKEVAKSKTAFETKMEAKIAARKAAKGSQGAQAAGHSPPPVSRHSNGSPRASTSTSTSPNHSPNSNHGQHSSSPSPPRARVAGESSSSSRPAAAATGQASRTPPRDHLAYRITRSPPKAGSSFR